MVDMQGCTDCTLYKWVLSFDLKVASEFLQCEQIVAMCSKAGGRLRESTSANNCFEFEEARELLQKRRK